MLVRIPCVLASPSHVPARHCLRPSEAVVKSWLLAQGPADTAVEEMHSVLRQIVARTIESEDCKGLAQFILLKREIATTTATALEKMKDDARKMVQTMVEMEGSYLTAEVFKENSIAVLKPRGRRATANPVWTPSEPSISLSLLEVWQPTPSYIHSNMGLPLGLQVCLIIEFTDTLKSATLLSSRLDNLS